MNNPQAFILGGSFKRGGGEIEIKKVLSIEKASLARHDGTVRRKEMRISHHNPPFLLLKSYRLSHYFFLISVQNYIEDALN